MRRFSTTLLERLERALQPPPAQPAFHVVYRDSPHQPWQQVLDAYVVSTGRTIAPTDMVVQVQFVGSADDLALYKAEDAQQH